VRKPIDLTGQKFGRLTVLGQAEHNKWNRPTWHCRCVCGNMVIVAGNSLRQKHTTSCGCLYREKTKIMGLKNVTHKETGSRLYRIWHNMKQRTGNKNHVAYARYGGRGITVCPEWIGSYEAFRDWALKNGYADNKTLDRKDNSLGYFEDNLTWSTMKEQQNNRRNNRMLTIDGQTKTLTQWSEQIGINALLVGNRLRLGWSPSEALGLVERKRAA
jgi:hypothetical protein